MEALFEYISYLNGNKFFWGVTMLFLNFGSRYVINDLGRIHEKILETELVKKIITFSLFFVATRDIIIAFVLTILYILIVDGVLHEKRKFSIVPKMFTTNVSDDEYKKALDIVRRYEDNKDNALDTDVYELYKESVSLL